MNAKNVATGSAATRVSASSPVLVRASQQNTTAAATNKAASQRALT